MHILDKFDIQRHFFSDPFPHVIIEDCLDDDLYSLLDKNFPDNEQFKPKIKEENQPYWIMGSDLRNLSEVWSNFIDEHLSQRFYDKAVEIISPFMADLDPSYVENLGKELKDCSFDLAEFGRGNNHKNKESDIVISVALGINTPCTTRSVIDPPHNDFPNKLFNSLLYMRRDEDDSYGGDLTLFQTGKKYVFTSKSEELYEVDQKYLKEIKTVKYSKNVLVLFPQKINAIHGVTARGPTQHTRRYININMESYVLKRKTFFETPRSTLGSLKFNMIRIFAIEKFKNLIRPFYRKILILLKS